MSNQNTAATTPAASADQKNAAEGSGYAGEGVGIALDFDSDEPLPNCPMRNNGDEVCESCQ